MLELSVAHARATIDGASVVLTSEAGRRLRYGDLFAEDAEGRLLASRIEAANPHLLRLVVEDAGAVYPIVIDPLITAIPDATLESNIAWSGSFDSTSFGASISGAGDVDILMGAAHYDAGEAEEGAVFVYHGSCGPGGPINQPPVAYAGTEQSVQDADGNGSEQITVDGSGSFDLDGSIASYEWFNGPTLLGTGAVLTTALAATGTHSLALVVTDDAGETGSDTLTVRVELGSTATGRAR